jgi:hypothetical protein
MGRRRTERRGYDTSAGPADKRWLGILEQDWISDGLSLAKAPLVHKSAPNACQVSG